MYSRQDDKEGNFDDDDDLDDENKCSDCGGYYNANRDTCDSCLFANSKI